jgi:hypothetical protein
MLVPDLFDTSLNGPGAVREWAVEEKIVEGKGEKDIEFECNYFVSVSGKLLALFMIYNAAFRDQEKRSGLLIMIMSILARGFQELP